MYYLHTGLQIHYQTHSYWMPTAIFYLENLLLGEGEKITNYITISALDTNKNCYILYMSVVLLVERIVLVVFQGQFNSQ